MPRTLFTKTPTLILCSGTDPKDIDKAEDRQKFSEILDSIGVDQPAWKELTSVADAEAFADEVSYPVLVRPSYVLSGAAMTVIRSKDDLKEKLEAASNVSPDHPVVITKFIEGVSVPLILHFELASGSHLKIRLLIH